MFALRVERWSRDDPPSDADVVEWFVANGALPHGWSNGPGDVYPAHTHATHKLLLVVRGSIRFQLRDSGIELSLGAGDRLHLPAGTVHAAVVGPEGVVCMEGHVPSDLEGPAGRAARAGRAGGAGGGDPADSGAPDFTGSD